MRRDSRQKSCISTNLSHKLNVGLSVFRCFVVITSSFDHIFSTSLRVVSSGWLEAICLTYASSPIFGDLVCHDVNKDRHSFGKKENNENETKYNTR